MSKPGIPKGTRDFLPAETARRNYIFSTIREVFQTYGFMPIETPALERVETLTGKYGDEGDQLIFRILNSGNYLQKVNYDSEAHAIKSDPINRIPEADKKKLSEITRSVAAKALRYDLTVPFARFVVQHRNDLAFPFKRYQIQPVWRADRPSKGRYQEFYQCDADVIGSTSLINEVELAQLIDNVFTALKVPTVIKLNNRKILSGIAEVIGEHEKLVPITVALDKLEKIGKDKVIEELQNREVSADAITKLEPLLELGGSNADKIATMNAFLADSETGMKGMEELQFVIDNVEALGLETSAVEFDVMLARGLNYYTGTIYEVKALGVEMGTICAGGRYDDLTGIFGLKDVSGVGISFGADRIYDVLNDLDAYPEGTAETTRLMFVNFGDAEAGQCMQWLKSIRAAGIRAELYPASVKMKNQMKYADAKKIPYVALAGSNEIEQGIISLKNMLDGSQSSVTIDQLIEKLK